MAIRRRKYQPQNGVASPASLSNTERHARFVAFILMTSAKGVARELTPGVVSIYIYICVLCVVCVWRADDDYQQKADGAYYTTSSAVLS